MAWRLAKALETLRDQINAAAPGRSKSSDGSIGDAAHASRSSDHNPWLQDGAMGVVTAIDITHDPRNGVDCESIAAALRGSQDTRLKYIIWHKRIWNPSVSPDWRPYTGANPHDKHIHISVKATKAFYDLTSPWKWGGSMLTPSAPAAEVRPLLRLGVTGQDFYVARAKEALMKALAAETGFGPLMTGLVCGFQTSRGLTPDGRIGAYTWAQL